MQETFVAKIVIAFGTHNGCLHFVPTDIEHHIKRKKRRFSCFLNKSITFAAETKTK